MSCNTCKKKINSPEGEQSNGRKDEPFFVRLILFLIITAFSPVILLVIFWMLFKYFFITGTIDMKNTALKIGNAIRNKEDKEEKEKVSEESENPDDYEYQEIYSVEKIK